MPRTMYSVSDISTIRPPTSRLLMRIVSMIFDSGRLYACSLRGSTVTTYCWTKPPTDATSDTPDAFHSWYLMNQSCKVRNSARDRLAPVTTY